MYICQIITCLCYSTNNTHQVSLRCIVLYSQLHNYTFIATVIVIYSQTLIHMDVVQIWKFISWKCLYIVWLAIGVGRCFIVSGQIYFQLSKVHNQPRSDVRSFYAYYVVQNILKLQWIWGHAPRKKMKIACFEIDFGGILCMYKNSYVSTNLLNFRLN